VCSVANLTRQDGVDFLALAARTPLHTAVKTFALDDANAALEGLRTSTITGAAVLVP
jgi:propanol-preferring alcohol dehydrogenase